MPSGGAASASAGGSLGDRLSGDAKAEYEAGRLLFGDHDFAGALVKFRLAYDHSKEPRLLFDMGACEKNLRHYAKTIADFERYRTEAGATLTPAEIDEADRLLRELRPFVGTLRVTSNEPGGHVFVDDEPVGDTPLAAPQPVDIGERRVRVTKDGFREFAATVTVAGEGEIPVGAVLEKIVHEGRLVVRAGAKDFIDLDGARKAIGSIDLTLPSGGHELRVSAPGMQTFQTDVLVADDQMRTVDVTLTPRSTGVPLWAWIAGGAVVAAGAAVGGYFLFKPKDEPGSPTSGTISPGVVTLSSVRR